MQPHTLRCVRYTNKFCFLNWFNNNQSTLTDLTDLLYILFYNLFFYINSYFLNIKTNRAKNTMSNKLSKITNLVMLKLVTLSLFTAFLTTTVIINSAHAVEESWTFAKFNRYSCADPLYGTNGTYWAEATVTYPNRSDYTASCSNGHSSNASGSVITASQTLRAATAMTVGLISKRIDAVRTAR